MDIIPAIQDSDMSEPLLVLALLEHARKFLARNGWSKKIFGLDTLIGVVFKLLLARALIELTRKFLALNGSSHKNFGSNTLAIQDIWDEKTTTLSICFTFFQAIFLWLMQPQKVGPYIF